MIDVHIYNNTNCICAYAQMHVWIHSSCASVLCVYVLFICKPFLFYEGTCGCFTDFGGGGLSLGVILLQYSSAVCCVLRGNSGDALWLMASANAIHKLA